MTGQDTRTDAALPARTIGGVEVPQVLMKAVEEHVDSLEIVRLCIRELPQTLRDSFPKYFDPDIDEACLSNLLDGMKDLKNGTLLSKDGILILESPSDLLHELAKGLRGAAFCEPVAKELNLAPHITRLSERLDEAACAMSWSATLSVEQWADQMLQKFYPDAEVPTPPLPPPPHDHS